MIQSSKLIFFGNERLVSGLQHTDAPVLRALIDSGYDIRAIVSSHKDGRSRSSRHLEVADIALEHNIPLLLPHKPGDIVEKLRSYEADAAVLVAYGRIIPQRVIDVFAPHGIINLHPSLLPRHRGPTPIESTILSGDHEAGVSIMQLSAGMDEGPVYAQTTFPLHGKETKQELYDNLATTGTRLMIETLPLILSGSLNPVPQKNIGVTYTSLLSKSDGNINPLTDTAHRIERQIRAYENFPKCRLRIKDNVVIVTSAICVQHDDPGRLIIPCAQNTWLEITSLIAPSGRTMSGSAYMHGYAT